MQPNNVNRKLVQAEPVWNAWELYEMEPPRKTRCQAVYLVAGIQCAQMATCGDRCDTHAALALTR